MSSQRDAVRSNRILWDQLTQINQQETDESYLELQAGGLCLRNLERGVLGDVSGLFILHQMCGTGAQTLSLAKLGAEMTGIDFSEPSIRCARDRSQQHGIPATFFCGEVVEDIVGFSNGFDWVVAMYGVLRWIPDLTAWACATRRALKPGGRLLLIDRHPMVNLLTGNPTGPIVAGDYYHASQGTVWELDLPQDGLHSIEWAHSIADLMMATTGAGLVWSRFEELPMSHEPSIQGLILESDGWWRTPPEWPRFPLLFLLEAKAV